MAKKYSLTPEHRAQLHDWHRRWVRIAMRTDPQTASDRDAMIAAVNGLYDAAKLDRPHIAFVQSPLVGQVASGFAAAIWHIAEKSHPLTRAATLAATLAATEAATEAATLAATWAATRAATEAATLAATEAATRAATRAATLAATWDATEAATLAATLAATEAATWDATRDATRAATEAATWDATDTEVWALRLATAISPSAAEFLCSCARSAMSMYAGGNMWAAGVDLISFFRHVAQLEIDYDKWRHYEDAAIYGGFRFMHPRFCIVCDFPERILVDESNRPHCADGPSHRWRDGFEIYHWHGYRIPEDRVWIINDKSRITADAIMSEPNAELRRVMCEVTGFEPIKSIATIISEDVDGNCHPRRLMTAEIGGDEIRIISVLNGSREPDGSRREFLLGAMPGSSPHECVAASYGINTAAYKEACRT